MFRPKINTKKKEVSQVSKVDFFIIEIILKENNQSFLARVYSTSHHINIYV
jgi:hypothetical protein